MEFAGEGVLLSPPPISMLTRLLLRSLQQRAPLAAAVTSSMVCPHGCAQCVIGRHGHSTYLRVLFGFSIRPRAEVPKMRP